ncbi:hypothetical protein BJ971_005607 [Actinoplanes digitatis]|uniref:Uncharacterized protein n=1 Tax=Actinoplanes digitatis TaxID=1868 RepID=A0A7W7MS75_9ACTN|nr:hypothetical protein [Actinoplanes digitatis]
MAKHDHDTLYLIAGAYDDTKPRSRTTRRARQGVA